MGVGGARAIDALFDFEGSEVVFTIEIATNSDLAPGFQPIDLFPVAGVLTGVVVDRRRDAIDPIVAGIGVESQMLSDLRGEVVRDFGAHHVFELEATE